MDGSQLIPYNVLQQSREAHVREVLEREMTMAANLSHEVWVLHSAIKLLPDEEISEGGLEKLRVLFEEVISQQNLHSASSAAKVYYQELKKHAQKLTLTSNGKLDGRTGTANIAKLIRKLSKPFGKQVVDFLSHRTHRAIVEEPGTKHSITPVIAVNDLTGRVLESVVAASSRTATLDILEILELLGFVRIVQGFDELIESYLDDVGNGNPISAHIQKFSPEERQGHNRYPVRKAHSAEISYQTIKKTTKLIMLTSKFFEFVHLRGSTTSRWNSEHADAEQKVRENYLSALKRIVRTGTLAALAAFGGTSAGAENALSYDPFRGIVSGWHTSIDTASPALEIDGAKDASSLEVGIARVYDDFGLKAVDHFTNTRSLTGNIIDYADDHSSSIEALTASAADQLTGSGKLITKEPFMLLELNNVAEADGRQLGIVSFYLDDTPSMQAYGAAPDSGEVLSASAADQLTGSGKLITQVPFTMVGFNDLDGSLETVFRDETEAIGRQQDVGAAFQVNNVTWMTPDDVTKGIEPWLASAADQATGSGRLITQEPFVMVDFSEPEGSFEAVSKNGTEAVGIKLDINPAYQNNVLFMTNPRESAEDAVVNWSYQMGSSQIGS